MVVFHIEGEWRAACLFELREASDGFARNAVHGDRIKIVAVRLGNPDRRHGGVEDLTVGILDEKQVAHAGGSEL